MKNKKLEIEDLISKLDLTPAMYENAKEKYDSLKDFLKNKDESIIFHPHGSFMLGTTVRPYKEQIERNYDLDSICLFNKRKNETSPNEIRTLLQNWLESTEIYNSKLEMYERCITINYADYGSIGFSIDVVPSALATYETKTQMLSKGCLPECVNTAIEVAEVKKYNTGNWISSNPQAYVKWFEEINEPFANRSRTERKRRIFERNEGLYKSEEDVPEYFNKSSLQMAIQLLKRARDVHFSKLGKAKEGLKPISAIITTIVLDTAKRNLIPYNADVFEVIKIVLNELKVYSKYQELSEERFKALYESKVAITKNESKWEMWNPVNPIDNLVDSWNVEPERARLFFEWVSKLDKTLLEIFDENNVDYERSIGNVLGNKIVKEYYDLKDVPTIERGPSPWKT